MKRTMALALITVAAFLTGCSDNGPGGAVSLSFASRPAGGASASVSGWSLQGAGQSHLVLDSVLVVLREIELERVEVVDCDVEPEPPGCEDFETGPVLIDVPLTGGANHQVTIMLEAGTYDEIEFDIHKVSSGSAEEAFVTKYPHMDGKSIAVWGTFDGVAFEYSTDLMDEQEVALSPPLELTADASTNVTIRLDVSTWFLDASGAEIDPSTANKGGDNENLVTDNIRNSIRAFEDRDSDGDDTDEG